MASAQPYLAAPSTWLSSLFTLLPPHPLRLTGGLPTATTLPQSLMWWGASRQGKDPPVAVRLELRHWGHACKWSPFRDHPMRLCVDAGGPAECLACQGGTLLLRHPQCKCPWCCFKPSLLGPWSHCRPCEDVRDRSPPRQPLGSCRSGYRADIPVWTCAPPSEMPNKLCLLGGCGSPECVCPAITRAGRWLVLVSRQAHTSP